MYTDGVTDTVGENGRLEEQRLRALLVEGTSTPPSELLGALEAALSRFQVATNRRAEEIASWDPFDSKHGR